MTDTRRPSGLIAILRGLPSADAARVGSALYETGMRTLEVPLNSPDPLRAIEVLREELPDDARVGAGTVLTTAQVRSVHDAGGQIVVSPNVDADVVRATVELGMDSYPGVATVTEAFTAVHAGARAVKLFPSTQVGIDGMKAWRAVLPADLELVPVGGIGAASLGAWVEAGATGFGIGSAVYRPGIAEEEMVAVAAELVGAWDEAAPRLRPLGADGPATSR
ncbi:2-dehydro-3-deoxy-6-phosphogalactonate aldolase [Nocardiopsis sp. NPDC006198]|uniref:2-dehydro-3-deoxy-6-phosphogalactonate aldolase n=1 Tax=Nocardiopsis sp. NPDC006198 TaxID=3154472 RepID=UPI0033A173DC